MSNYYISVDDGDTYIITCIEAQGPAGPPGSGSSASFINGEVPSGALDGSNATFTTQYNFIPESVEVYVNGQRQKLGADYTTAGTQTINLTFSPASSEVLTVDYQR